jgi:hypothetical protein
VLYTNPQDGSVTFVSLQVVRIQGQLAKHDKKFVDTDAWQEGVIQRVPTDALITRLGEEERQLRDSIKEVEDDIAYILRRWVLMGRFVCGTKSAGAYQKHRGGRSPSYLTCSLIPPPFSRA